MGKKSKRRVSTPTAFKGQIPAFITVAEQLPEVFRAHVVSKLSLADALSLAQVSKFYKAELKSAKAMLLPNRSSFSKPAAQSVRKSRYLTRRCALRTFNQWLH